MHYELCSAAGSPIENEKLTTKISLPDYYC